KHSSQCRRIRRATALVSDIRFCRGPTTPMTSTSLRAPDPRDLLRSVVIWLLLIPLALLAFLAAETTEIDLVDTVNAAAYAFAGLLSVVLARQAMTGAPGR